MSAGHGRPIPGHNLPFSLKSPRLMAVAFTFYMGSGFALPFLAARRQMKKMYNT